MIYKNSYFKEELKKSYLDTKESRLKLLGICMLVSLFSIALNSFFVMMGDTVIGDTFPALCTKSFYAVITMMNAVILVFFVFYFTNNYETATFAEINKNRWYMLIKSGYKNDYMIFVKQITTGIMVITLYSLSFLFCFIITSLLRYGMSLSSILPSYIIGIVQLAVMTTIILNFSLFLKKNVSNLSLSIIYLIFIAIVSAICGFTKTTKISSGMSFKTLFTGTTSIYMYTLLALGLINVIASVLIAMKKSNYYNTAGGKVENVIVIDFKTNEVVKVKKDGMSTFSTFAKKVVFGCLIAIMIAGVLANAALIIMGSASGDEFSVMGSKPYIFASHTMKGSIEYNDFVVFSPLGEGETLTQDSVVIFYDGKEYQIRKVEKVNSDNTVTVDITSYPAGAELNAYEVTLSQDEIKGVMTFKSRWIGAWLVWNNSLAGKIVTLLLPLLTLAFYDKLAKLMKMFANKLVKS